MYANHCGVPERSSTAPPIGPLFAANIWYPGSWSQLWTAQLATFL